MTSPTLEGTYSLRLTQPAGETSPGIRQIHSTSGLPAYPEDGHIVEYKTQFGSSTLYQCWMAVQSEGRRNPDGYEILMWPSDGSLYLRKQLSGNRSILNSDTSVSYSTGMEYDWTLEWLTEGGLTVALEQSGSLKTKITATDYSFSSDGLGWGAGKKNHTEAALYADSMRKIQPYPNWLSFSRLSSNPVVQPGSSGAWDDDVLSFPDVLIEEDTWYLYYYGQDSNGNVGMGLAESTSGVSFTKNSNNPLLTWGQAVPGTSLISRILRFSLTIRSINFCTGGQTQMGMPGSGSRIHRISSRGRKTVIIQF